MSLATRLSRGVKAMFGANMADTLSKAVLVVVLTRVLLTPQEYGQLNFVLSALGVLAILATLGLPKSAARYVTEFSETDPGQVPHVMRRSLGYLSVLVGAVVSAVVLFGDEIARAFGAPSLAPYLLVGSGLVVARAYSMYFGSIFQGFNRVSWTAAVSVVSAVSRLVFVLGFVALGFGVIGALAGYVVASLLGTIVGAVVIYLRFYRPFDAAEDVAPNLTRRILEYAVPLTATRGAGVLDKKVDTLLVGMLVNMTAVGFYTVGKQVSDFVSVPAAAFGFTLSPALAEQKAGDRTERAARLYERSLQYVLLLYVPAVVGLVLVAGPMVRYVFGSDYLGAVPVVQIFSGYILVNAVNKITSDGLDYLGRARSRAVIKSGMAVSNFLLNLLLIPLVGVVGAAIATVVTYTAYTASNVYFIHQELSLSFVSVVRTLWVVCLVTAGMVVIVTGALPYVSGIVSLLAVVALGATTWAVLSVVSGVVDVREVVRFLT